MTEILCIACPVFWPKGRLNKPTTPNVCNSCRKRLELDVASIAASYALIDAEPVRGTTEIRSRAYESKPPLNIAALSLLGPGEDTPPARLEFWVQDWAGTLEQALPPAAVEDMCVWLIARLPWACDTHPAIDEFAADVKDLSGQLRSYAITDRGTSVGRCPRDRSGERCNTQLFVDPYVDEIKCSRCQMTWKRKAGEWMHLRAQQLAAGVEAAA